MDGILIILVIAAFAYFSSLNSKKQKEAASRKNASSSPERRSTIQQSGAQPKVVLRKKEEDKEEWFDKMEGYLKKIGEEEMPIYDPKTLYFPSHRGKEAEAIPREKTLQKTESFAEERMRKENTEQLFKEKALTESKKTHHSAIKKEGAATDEKQKPPLTFSEDPLVQGLIMGEVFKRPCERKRGYR